MELKVLRQYQVSMDEEEINLICRQMEKTAGNRKESAEDRQLAGVILNVLLGHATSTDDRPTLYLRKTKNDEALDDE